MAALPLALMTSVQAQSSLAEIQRAGVIKIGTEGAYPPFTYHDKSGKLVGFDVEIGELIASGLGVKPEFVEGKWDGLIAGVDAKRYDLVLNEVAITPERLKNMTFQTLHHLQGGDRGAQRQPQHQEFCRSEGQEILPVADQQLRSAGEIIGRRGGGHRGIQPVP